MSRGRGRGGQRSVNIATESSEQFMWTDFDTDSHPNSNREILGEAGPSIAAKELETPLDYLFLMLGVDIFQFIAMETNRYANQQGVGDFEVSSVERAAFVGLNIAMGIVSLPKIHDYWSTNPILRHPWFSSVMARNRFFAIQRYLHFNENMVISRRDDPVHDKLGKVCPILDRVRKTFPENYSLTANVSIDEQMIGTKGRLSFLQYLPKKPKKWGIKLWVLADSSMVMFLFLMFTLVHLTVFDMV